MTDRDPKTGRFLPRHKQLSSRDKTTGRFVKKTTDEERDRYIAVSREVDSFLEGLEVD